MKTLYASPLILLVSSILCACAPFKPKDDHAGMCNELNSRLIFNGATSNTRNAEIQAAEAPLLQRSYGKKCQ